MRDAHPKDDAIAFVKRRVVESTFRQSADQGHLSAFKTKANTSARARFLSLVTFPAGLAMSGTFAAAETFHPVA